MALWQVHVVVDGHVVVEADDEESACDRALDAVLDDAIVPIVELVTTDFAQPAAAWQRVTE